MWYNSIFGGSPWGALAFYFLLWLPAIAAYFYGRKQRLPISIIIIVCWLQLVLMDHAWIGLGFYIIAWVAAAVSIFGKEPETGPS